VAVTTALEMLTAPYSPAVSAYPLNGAVHVLKVVAALAFVAGLVALARQWRARGERLASIAAAAMALGTAAGAVPYSGAEALLASDLSPAAADRRLDGVYLDHPWIGVVASAALPLVLLSLVALAVVALRHRLVPAWAAYASLAGIPVAVLAGLAGEAGWAVPHPPAWIFLGLAAYGPALLRVPEPRPAAAAEELTSRLSG
jgi:hypothetical protein